MSQALIPNQIGGPAMRIRMGQLARRLAPHVYARYVDRARHQQRQRIARLLADPTPPTLLGVESWDALMARSLPRSSEYPYDRFSATGRAGGRVQRLASLLPALQRPCTVLEVSCGEGLVGAVMAVGGHEVVLTDIRDWRSDGARHLPFVQWDVGDAPPFDARRFDLVVAYNATEHWTDPDTALAHLLAACKPGGYVVLDFGPLFNSPWGLHAWSLGFPYPQFLFDREVINTGIARIGVNDVGHAASVLQSTNGWTIESFRTLWQRCGAATLQLTEDRDYRYLDFVEEFGPCFRGRGLSLEDLTINSIEIVLQKPSATASQNEF